MTPGTVFCDSGTPAPMWVGQPIVERVRESAAERELLRILARAHAYLDDHPQQYPPRRRRPILGEIQP